MPFTQENLPLLEEAASIDFQFMKNGAINSGKHSSYERGLYFIKQAVEKHGNTYGYQEVSYVTNRTKVTLLCSKHGRFEQSPTNHLKGQDCPKCAGTASLTTEEFITEAIGVHGHRYSYTFVVYKGKQERVKIVCREHGPFFQKPSDHLRGSNCPKCSGRHSYSSEEFMEISRSVHGDKYDYTTSKYVGMHEKLEILCPDHGSFYQTPANHIHNKRGCPKCSGNYSPTTEEFIEKARNTHGDKYDYSYVQYKNNKEKVEIVCPLHGSFFQAPDSHLSFRGCPTCAGKNHDILYLLKCLETGWYKIGITADNVQKRIASIGGNLEEIHHVVLEDPRKHESILHKKYEKDREHNLCVKSGNTEFFSLTEDQVQEVIDYMNEVSSA